MARLQNGWMLTVRLNGDLTGTMFHYDSIYLDQALEEFWHTDYESLVDCDGSGEFPIDGVVVIDDDGIVEGECHLMFNMAAFDHYFDKGWSASSKEPGQRYTWEQFLKDIEVKDEPEKAYVVTFINDTAWELPNVSVNVRKTMDEARKCLDEEWQTLKDEHENWQQDVSKKNDFDFLFVDNKEDRTIGEIHEKELN